MSSFQLKFWPNFSKQRKAWLAQTRVPEIEIPEALDRALEAFARESTELNHTTDPKARSRGVASLWLETFGCVRSLLGRATGCAFAASVFAAAATIVATRILTADASLVTMLGAAVAFFVFNLAAHGAIYRSNRYRNWIWLGVETHWVSRVSRKILALSASASARQSSGNLKVLIASDVKNVGQFMDNFVRNFIPACTAVIVISPLLAHYAGRAGLLGVLVMASVLPLAAGLNLISVYFQNRQQKRLDQLTSLVGEWVKNARLLRFLSWEKVFEGEIARKLRGFMGFSTGQHLMACLIFGLSLSWWMVTVTSVVLLSRWLGQSLDLVGFFGALWLLNFLAHYLAHLPNLIRLYAQAAPSLERIRVLLQEPTQAELLRPGHPLPSGVRPRTVRFEAVSVVFPTGHRAIDGLTLSVALARKTAVVGEVGAGKTTLLKLLSGELPPSEGAIWVEFENGESRELWTHGAYTAYREALAYVPQEPFISSDTLGSNVTLDPETEAEGGALEAAYWAELEADLAHFRGGLREGVGEGGVNLSGGQKQRLNLARARHAQRDCLLLDDPLSAVDARTERALMENLEKQRAGFVLVTHRTAELARVEEVIVMAAGRVVERGRPDELAADPRSRLTQVLRAYAVSEGSASDG